MDEEWTTEPGSVDLSEDYQEQYVPYSERPETYLVPIIFAIIFLVGVLGNGTLIAIFIRHRTMRNVPNLFIMSLAVGDLLVIVTCVPFTSTLYTFESWPYGHIICKLHEVSKDVSIGVSVFNLTALSAERYWAIVNPMKRHKSMKMLTVIIALSIWALSIILALPAALFTQVLTADLSNNFTISYCTPFPPNFGQSYPQGIVILRFLVYYTVPLCVIACCYVQMARHLVLASRNMPGEHQGHLHHIKVRGKIAKLVLFFVVIFMICFLPSHIFSIWYFCYQDDNKRYTYFWHYFRIVAFCLSYINSCANPIALYFLSKKFKKYFNKYLFCCCTHPSYELKTNQTSQSRAARETIEGNLRTITHVSQQEGVTECHC